MSRIIPLKQVLEMSAGEIVPAVRCQIKSVGKIYKGSNEHGEFTVQKITVLDDTAVLTLKLWDKDEFSTDWQGVWIICESTPGKGGKLGGLMTVDDEYPKNSGKVTRQIHAKSGSTIEEATDLAPVAPATPPAFHQPPAQATVPAAVRPAPVKPLAAGGSASQALPIKPTPSKEDGVAAARAKLGQISNALILSYSASIYVSEQVQAMHRDITIPLFSPDILEKIAVSMCIELARSGLIMGLPTGPLPAKKAPLPPSQMEEPPDDYGSIPE